MHVYFSVCHSVSGGPQHQASDMFDINPAAAFNIHSTWRSSTLRQPVLLGSNEPSPCARSALIAPRWTSCFTAAVLTIDSAADSSS